MATKQRRITVESSNSVIAFERDGGPDRWGDWFLTIEGERAFDLGYPCESCTWIFERVGEAALAVSPRDISDRLGAGNVSVDEDALMQSVAQAIPAGEYTASVLEIRPTLVTPGKAGDYFTNEFAKSSKYRNHAAGTDYYRSLTRRFPAADTGREHDELFVELIVPLYPTEVCIPREVQRWAERLDRGERPAALAVSVINSVHLNDWGRAFEPDPPTHWVLTHYLLDGHHKMLAASRDQRSLQLLSLLHGDLSFGWSIFVEHVFDLRARAAQR